MASTVELPLLTVDRGGSRTLQQQVTDGLRQSIISGAVATSARLPATRGLSRRLGVGRNTILNAYEQLALEGYARGRLGSGTYVAADLPDPKLRAASGIAERIGPDPVLHPTERLNRIRRAPFLDTSNPSLFRPFCPSIPSSSDFPIEEWESVRRRVLRTGSARLLEYAHPQGHPALREAIANHCRDYRGVLCHADQIVITSGAQAGFNLVLGVLSDVGSPVWVEDPGYIGFRGAAEASGGLVVHRPVDAEGIVLPHGRPAKAPALIYVTPSHQFPLGVTMSLRRRMALLDFAERNGTWIIEDDYDSEHRYSGRPLPALQGLRAGGRVVYVGTFSKTLFPALRLGFLIVPPLLVADFTRLRAILDTFSPTIDQAVLARFLSDGRYARHLRRMQYIYGERRDAFCAEMDRLLSGRVRLERPSSGLSLAGWFPAGSDDRARCLRAAEAGLTVLPISIFCNRARCAPGAIFGFAAFPPGELRRSVAKLAHAWA
ncbi:MAG: PLP-dependent aminotransferase family protein [Opitutaceae bacterium]